MKKKSFSIHEAKTKFSALINLVKQGETVIIMNAGVPVATLVPIAAQRKAGELLGKIKIEEDFDAELDPLTFTEKKLAKKKKAS